MQPFLKLAAGVTFAFDSENGQLTIQLGGVAMHDILKLVRERQSARISFDLQRPIARQDLEQILDAGSWAPTAHNMQNFEMLVVDDPKLLEMIWKIKNPISMEFIKENYQQLSFSEGGLIQKKVGILATRFPPAWRNPDVTIDQLMADDRPLLPSPVMLIMIYDPGKRAPASDGDFLGIISLGCVTENMWLMAEALGIGFHIVSSLGEGPAEKEVKRILSIPDSLQIVYAIRLGYPVSGPDKYLRVRREVKDFTHHNRFGNKSFT
jgi:nitroreductase